MIQIFCVYKITNLVNSKSYIGITKRNPKIRFNEHFSNKNELLYKAKEKYGRESFALEIIEKNISEALKLMEMSIEDTLKTVQNSRKELK